MFPAVSQQASSLALGSHGEASIRARLLSEWNYRVSHSLSSYRSMFRLRLMMIMKEREARETRGSLWHQPHLVLHHQKGC